MDIMPDSLRAQALQARARGDHAAAADAWRSLLQRDLENWQLTLELKRDLKSSFHYPESDPVFRQGARFLPDAEWLAHYAGLYVFHGADLDVLHRRATALLPLYPDDARVPTILGDVARQARDWAGAVRAFTRAATLDPLNPEHPAKLAAAQHYARLAPVLAAAPRGTVEYSVALVSLDRNTERQAEVARQFAGCPVPLRRVPAVEGSRLADAAVRRLTGTAGALRGTLGCFLSHAAAWEAVLARADGPCLIIEDDVVPLLALPPTLDVLGLPPDFDVCFVNDRLEPRLPRDGTGFTAQPVAETMLAFHPEDNAPGGDGYLISPAGAAKLLDWVAQDGFAGDVDWRLLAYALSPAEVAALSPAAHAWRVLDELRHLVPRADRLRAYALHPALVRTVGVSSDREDENRAHPG